MSESKEIHKFREKLRYALRKDHPNWSSEKIKIEIARKLTEFRNSSRKVLEGSESGSEVQNPEPMGSKNNSRGKAASIRPYSSEKRFRGSKSKFEYPRFWIKLDHSIDKSQIILKESIDGISWKTTAILTKDQPFERNELIISAAWHKGSTKDGSSR